MYHDDVLSIGLSVILVILSVSIFKTADILYKLRSICHYQLNLLLHAPFNSNWLLEQVFLCYTYCWKNNAVHFLIFFITCKVERIWKDYVCITQQIKYISIFVNIISAYSMANYGMSMWVEYIYFVFQHILWPSMVCQCVY